MANPITLFLASSTAARAQAKAIASALASDTVSFLPWWEAFTPGGTLLSELNSLRKRVQGALVVVTPESNASVRGKEVEIPNLNVLFEFGFFYGAFASERVAIVKYGEYFLPSDLGGYIHIAGSSIFKRGASQKVGKKTRTEFQRWVTSPGFLGAAQLGGQTSQPSEPSLRREVLNGLNQRRMISRGQY